MGATDLCGAHTEPPPPPPFYPASVPIVLQIKQRMIEKLNQGDQVLIPGAASEPEAGTALAVHYSINEEDTAGTDLP